MRINTQNIIQMNRNTYAHLGDEESKYIFKERCLFSLTDDVSHIRNIVTKTVDGADQIAALSPEDVYLFGAGVWGKKILYYLQYCCE